MRTHTNWYNIWCICFVCLGSYTWGYAAGIVGTTLAQPSFLERFDLVNDASYRASIFGAINGLFSVGGFIGCIGSCWVNDKYGRRVAISFGSGVATIGSALQAGSVAIPMYLVARLVTGLGVGFLLCLIPVYQSEISPAHNRGLLVGMHGVALCFGYVSSSWIGVGFYFVQNPNLAWRMPLVVGCVASLILTVGVKYVPESPRWLAGRGRVEECQAILKRLHYDVEHPESMAYMDEVHQIVAQIEADRSQESSWMSLLRHKPYRDRCLIGFFTCFGGQATGTLVINNYAGLIYGTLGFDEFMVLVLQAAWITVSPIGNAINAVLMDRYGRVKILVIGFLGSAFALVGLVIMLALFSGTGNQAGNAAATFFIFLHVGFYSSTTDATSYVYSAEIFPYHIRAKGMAISVSGLFVGTGIFLTSAPAGFEAIGWKYYFSLIIPTIILAFAFWKWWPETMGLTLEEIGAKFGDNVVSQEHAMVQDPARLEQGSQEKFYQEDKGEAVHVEEVSRAS